MAHRRLFEKDVVRFFVGEVDAYDAGIIKARGHSYVRDMMGGQVVGKEEARTTILSLSSGTLIVYQLPDAVELDAMRFVATDLELRMTDGRGFTMNLTEVTHGGRL